MVARKLDGKACAAKVKAGVSLDIAAMHAKPKLAIVMAGTGGECDPASEVYVRNKVRDCDEVGITATVVQCPDAGGAELINTVDDLSLDTRVDGIIVQLPLPAHIDPRRVLDQVYVGKDVDGLSSTSIARLWSGGHMDYLPCTPAGVMRLLGEYGLVRPGGRASVVGRSDIVGKPMAKLLLDAGYAVSILHSEVDRDAFYDTLRASDLVVAGAGRPGLISGTDLKPGAVVVDVSTTRTPEGLCGDCDPSVWDVAGWVSPVPGGVGPMTRAMLLHNVANAYRRHHGMGEVV